MSVVIPAYQSARHLTRCLEALGASTRLPLESLVVDDGSTDGGGSVAERYGAKVLRVPDGPRGPAVARNLGAAHALGDVVLFLDADVAVHPDTVAKVAEVFDAHPDVAAVFGSYDDRPADPSMVSQYRNLLHHYVHQRGRQEASTFWAGCGAVRCDVFRTVGGFDERYTHPSIEDIELGGRLRDGGYRVWLRPEIQVTHLKRWSLGAMIRSDIVDRAIPWTRLILARGTLPPRSEEHTSELQSQFVHH
jgi:GT2 family glycosyltransferase